MRRLVVALVLAGFGCASPRPAVSACEPRTADPTHARAALYQRTLDEQVAGRLPGAIALIRDADGLWMGASGEVDLAHGVSAQVCHRMPIASMTKTLVATVALILEARGVLSLDAPIAGHLPAEVAEAVANSDRITLRMLLNHTSGVPSYTNQAWYLRSIDNPGWVPTEEDALSAIRGQSLFEPGTAHRYGSTNYILAGRVIEDATGRPFEEVLRDELLDPLELSATSYAPGVAYEDIAQGYLDLYGDERYVESSWDDFLASTLRSPSAGVATDVLDLMRFMDALFRTDALLSARSRDEMLTEAIDSADPKHSAVGYGLGVEHYVWPEGEAWGHSGSLFGFESYAHYFPREDVTMVLLVNASSLSDGVDDHSVHAHLIGSVLPALRRAALVPR
ncbi:MAG: beta-lactamase family protein [Sandaracinaceae bacterium]|nr:beta-lactamase family protein [Sandaracinaceae bacterium]